ncbi:3D domain-containing protein [Salinimicrobium xinjiangense]|uniref:3D domain-containing protein n=1 Tax=Salinimicrobium xinjiangense TaxID=438596 RepID=UPI001FE03C60|nr:3D domain-containing protein [Salinimicrobium xinjiangense]
MLVFMVSVKLILKSFLLPVLLVIGMGSCNESTEEEFNFDEWEKMTVTASAYNSLKRQGEGNPLLTAWGDTLSPEVQSIAVSRDLIRKGLTYKTPVKIEGFDGIFIVNDKMHPRWRNKIDIYMGEDKTKALKWGRRKVEIAFPAEKITTD